MEITFNNKVGHVTNFEKDGVQINVFESGISEDLYNDLENLKPLANNKDKQEILNAQKGIDEQNENKVIEALKKLWPFIEKVSSTVVSTAIISYMKSKGIII